MDATLVLLSLAMIIIAAYGDYLRRKASERIVVLADHAVTLKRVLAEQAAEIAHLKAEADSLLNKIANAVKHIEDATDEYDN